MEDKLSNQYQHQLQLKHENNNKIKEGGNNQKLILFNRGKAISGAPIIKGTNQLPKPPIITGITIKKIINKAMSCYYNIIKLMILLKKMN